MDDEEYVRSPHGKSRCIPNATSHKRKACTRFILGPGGVASDRLDDASRE